MITKRESRVGEKNDEEFIVMVEKKQVVKKSEKEQPELEGRQGKRVFRRVWLSVLSAAESSRT